MYFSFKNNSYIAIIGDMKNSKIMNDRNSVQKRLKNILNGVNEKYSKDISAKFMITLGDEFQGLLHDGGHVMHIIEEIQREMHPVEIRFGIGVGPITTEINFEMAIGADGPGYYKARQAIEFLKDNEQKNMTHASDIRIEVDGDNEAASAMMNTVLSLLTFVKANWTDRQREIIRDTMKYGDSQAKSAGRLEVAQSSIQRGLKSANFYVYRDAIDTLSSVLMEIRREDV
ncbi:MAG: SatD family protein [Eubacteriales bacterium]